MKEFRGTGVAMITPFTKEGEIDFTVISNLMEEYVAAQVDYLVIMGTTAETVTLTKEEKNSLAEFVVSKNQGRLPLVIGLGGNNTTALVAEIKSTALTGFHAILSVCPYYNRPNQEGIYQHFAAIAAVSPLPIILYNVPARTGSSIENSTTLRLSKDFSNIIGIKDARGDLELAGELIAQHKEDFLVISGDDASALGLIERGGAGVISVLAGGLPEQFVRMIQLGLDNQFNEAKAILHDLLPFIELIFQEGNPTGLKALMHLMEKCQNTLRLPLVPASAELESLLQESLNHLQTPVKRG